MVTATQETRTIPAVVTAYRLKGWTGTKMPCVPQLSSRRPSLHTTRVIYSAKRSHVKLFRSIQETEER